MQRQCHLQFRQSWRLRALFAHLLRYAHSAPSPTPCPYNRLPCPQPRPRPPQRFRAGLLFQSSRRVHFALGRLGGWGRSSSLWCGSVACPTYSSRASLVFIGLHRVLLLAGGVPISSMARPWEFLLSTTRVLIGMYLRATSARRTARGPISRRAVRTCSSRTGWGSFKILFKRPSVFPGERSDQHRRRTVCRCLGVG